MDSKAPIVYLAGPIAGCSWDSAIDWRKWATKRLPECDVLPPMRGNEFLKEIDDLGTGEDHMNVVQTAARDAVERAIVSQHAIVGRDIWDVKMADMLLVNLLPSIDTGIASIGTCFELAWAYMLHKPAVVAMQESGNPNSHPFPREAAYVIVDTLEEAVFVTRQLLNLPPRPKKNHA